MDKKAMARKVSETRMAKYTAEERSEISRRGGITQGHPRSLARRIIKGWDRLTEAEKIEVKTILQSIFREK